MIAPREKRNPLHSHAEWNGHLQVLPAALRGPHPEKRSKTGRALHEKSVSFQLPFNENPMTGSSGQSSAWHIILVFCVKVDECVFHLRKSKFPKLYTCSQLLPCDYTCFSSGEALRTQPPGKSSSLNAFNLHGLAVHDTLP